MALTFYYAPRSSASPVKFALVELGVDHETVTLDISGDSHKTPELLALNPMGQVPTLVDDGAPIFESAACIIYLGERYGVERGLWPAVSSPGHMRALTWVAWSAVTLGSAIRQCFTSGEHAPEEMRNEAVYAAGVARYQELLGVLDNQLAGRPFIAGEAFSLADCYPAAAIVWASGVLGVDLSGFANIGAWVGKVMARPGAAAM